MPDESIPLGGDPVVVPVVLTPEQQRQIDEALRGHSPEVRRAVAACVPELCDRLQQAPVEGGRAQAFSPALIFQVLTQVLPLILDVLQKNGILKAS